MRSHVVSVLLAALLALGYVNIIVRLDRSFLKELSRNKKTYLPRQKVPLPSLDQRPSGAWVSWLRSRNVTEKYDLDTPGCRVRHPGRQTPAVRETAPPLVCQDENSPPPLVLANLTFLYVDVNALAYYDVRERRQLSCCYTPFSRWIGNLYTYNMHEEDRVRFDRYCSDFTEDGATIQIDFVKVVCQHRGDIIYTDYFAFTPLKRGGSQRREEGEEESLSVLVVGIDSVSRAGFHRQMPLTATFLREVGALEMLGYHKVADTTLSNVLALLTGLTVKEAKVRCWYGPLDACQMLWDVFSRDGYRTAYADDSPRHSIFSASRLGFVRQPTDYYLRPFLKAQGDGDGGQPCAGFRLALHAMMGYLDHFARTMSGARYFGLFWGMSLTRDRPHVRRVVDLAYQQTLRGLAHAGTLNHTLLVVASAHGLRVGHSRESKEGRLQDSLPLLSLVFPPWFKERYRDAVDNLRANAGRLTTPFDLHATLLDLLDLRRLEAAALLARDAENLGHRSASLFLKASVSRTCADAAIPRHWCACEPSRELFVTVQSTTVRRLAWRVLRHVNQRLLEHKMCAQLELESVRSARMQEDRGYYFLVVLTTRPGDIVLEADLYSNGSDITILDVTRIDYHSEQSSCLWDPDINMFCSCKNVTW